MPQFCQVSLHYVNRFIEDKINPVQKIIPKPFKNIAIKQKIYSGKKKPDLLFYPMPEIQPITYSNKGPLLARLLVTCIEYMTGRLWMEYSYTKCLQEHDKDLLKDPNTPFFESVLRFLNIDTEIASGALENIPTDKPLIVVANHPFGIVDGLILNALMHARRKDYFVLTNEVLFKAERMVPFLLPIDDTETAAGTEKNKKSILNTMRHLRDGGAICLFPSGRMARPTSWNGPFEDLDWQELVAHLVTRVKTKETDDAPYILPIFFEGANSTLFRLSTILKWYTLTRSLVINECKNKCDKTIRVHIGDLITPDDLPRDKDNLALAAWLREKTLALGSSQ